MRLKFVHAADLHLDSPFRAACEALPRELSAIFERATFKAFERIVSLCLREKVDFLLLAGDLFDSKDKSVRARLKLAGELARLDQAGIPTFIVCGNHDPLSAEGELGLPKSVKVFGATWEEVELQCRNARVRVQGISYPFEKVSENLSAYFGRKGPEFTVGLLHANVGGDRAHANYSPCTLADLARAGLDYWALGHVHTRATHALPNGLAVYPGNSQGRHAYEDGPRGCVLVEVDERPSVRFFPVDSVRWHRLDVDATPFERIDELAEAASAAIREVASDGERDAHAVRLALTGRSALHAELARPGATSQLSEVLAELGRKLSPPVFVESVRDETRAAVEVGSLRDAGGLAGTIAESLVVRPTENVLDELYADFELDKLEAALLRHGLYATRESAERLVERAAYRALDLLLEEGGR